MKEDWIKDRGHRDLAEELLGGAWGGAPRLTEAKVLASHGAAVTYMLRSASESAQAAVLKVCFSSAAREAPRAYALLAAAMPGATARLLNSAKLGSGCVLLFEALELEGSRGATPGEVQRGLREMRQAIATLTKAEPGLASNLPRRSIQDLIAYLVELGVRLRGARCSAESLSPRLMRWSGVPVSADLLSFTDFGQLTGAVELARCAEASLSLPGSEETLCHPDPSPGNFRIVADGSMRILDWDEAWFGNGLISIAAAIDPDVSGQVSVSKAAPRAVEASTSYEAARRTAPLFHLWRVIDCLDSTCRERDVPAYVAAWLLRRRHQSACISRC